LKRLTESGPRRVGWLLLDVECRVNSRAVSGQCVPVAQKLPESQPQLVLLVRRGRAFYLGHVEVCPVPPNKVELRIVIGRGERHQPSGGHVRGKLVL
jgi:hypothetical protein